MAAKWKRGRAVTNGEELIHAVHVDSSSFDEKSRSQHRTACERDEGREKPNTVCEAHTQFAPSQKAALLFTFYLFSDQRFLLRERCLPATEPLSKKTQARQVTALSSLYRASNNPPHRQQALLPREALRGI